MRNGIIAALLLIIASSIDHTGVGDHVSGEVPSPPYRLEDISYGLERRSCCGRCPEYSIEVKGTGQVRYNGRSNVSVVGAMESSIEQDQVLKLLDAFNSVEFTEMRDSYLNRQYSVLGIDGLVHYQHRILKGPPEIAVSLHIKEYAKEVVFFTDYAPIGLVELANRIDEVAASSQWVAPHPDDAKK